jgi:hypothetical protein
MYDLNFFYSQVDIIVGNEQQQNQLLSFDKNLSIHINLPTHYKKYVVFLKENVEVTDPEYFLQIQWLINQNTYLDVLKHTSWL